MRLISNNNLTYNQQLSKLATTTTTYLYTTNKQLSTIYVYL